MPILRPPHLSAGERKTFARILQLPESHPARRGLLALYRCRVECVGREIRWIGREHEAVDQAWLSQTDGRKWLWSHFLYAYISVSRPGELEGWLAQPAGEQLVESERRCLDNLLRLLLMVSECEQAAAAEGNQKVLDMIPLVREVFACFEQAIHLRWTEVGANGTGRPSIK